MQVEGSIMWLLRFGTSNAAEETLRSEAGTMGLDDPLRIVCACMCAYIMWLLRFGTSNAAEETLRNEAVKMGLDDPLRIVCAHIHICLSLSLFCLSLFFSLSLSPSLPISIVWCTHICHVYALTFLHACIFTLCNETVTMGLGDPAQKCVCPYIYISLSPSLSPNSLSFPFSLFCSFYLRIYVI